MISESKFLLSYLRGKVSERINQQSSIPKAQCILADFKVLGNICLFCFAWGWGGCALAQGFSVLFMP